MYISWVPSLTGMLIPNGTWIALFGPILGWYVRPRWGRGVVFGKPQRGVAYQPRVQPWEEWFPGLAFLQNAPFVPV